MSISLVIRSPPSTWIKCNDDIQTKFGPSRAGQKSVTYVFGHLLPISPVRTTLPITRLKPGVNENLDFSYLEKRYGS